MLALPKLRARYGLTDDHVAELLEAYGRQAETISGALALPDGWRSAGSAPAVPAEDVPSYLASIDVGLVPYSGSAFNRASFPPAFVWECQSFSCFLRQRFGRLLRQRSMFRSSRTVRSPR